MLTYFLQSVYSSYLRAFSSYTYCIPLLTWTYTDRFSTRFVLGAYGRTRRLTILMIPDRRHFNRGTRSPVGFLKISHPQVILSFAQIQDSHVRAHLIPRMAEHRRTHRQNVGDPEPRPCLHKATRPRSRLQLASRPPERQVHGGRFL
jgi:hypothetical protein